MKKFVFFFTMLLIFLSACDSGKDKSETVVREYISAIQNGDWAKAKSLVYDISVSNDVANFPEEQKYSSIKPDSTSNIDIFNINTWRHYAIKNVDDIEVKKIKKENKKLSSDSNIRTIVFEDSVKFKSGVVRIPNIPIYIVESAYCVRVKSGEKYINFIVVENDENQFKICEADGLYDYDIEGLKKQTGCEILLFHENYVDLESLSECLNCLKNFNDFSNAVEMGDTSFIYSAYPSLKKYQHTFKGRPKAIKYTLRNDYDFSTATLSQFMIIECADSTAYFIKDDKITNSYNVISCEDLIEEIKAFDAVPKSRLSGDKYKIINTENDLSYIARLNKQKNDLIAEHKRKEEELRKENERKARVAKYKSQGVALIGSHFTNDGKGAKGVEYTALNTSDKTAKYIIMEVVGYNAVDDPVWSDGYLKRCRGIGPISPGESGRWDFNDLWERGDLVESYEIKALIIQFNDGTSKRVKLPEELPYGWKDWLY